jgi:glycosyltransferase XagB
VRPAWSIPEIALKLMDVSVARRRSLSAAYAGRFRSVSTFAKQAPAGGHAWAQQVEGAAFAAERRNPAFAAARASGDFAPEIAFLAAQGLEPGLLLRAMAKARSAGVSADQALLGEGLLGEEDYYRALARHLRLPFYRGEIAVDAAVEAEPAIAYGLAPLAANRAGLRFIAAPRAAMLRFLFAQAAIGALPPGLAIASPQRLSAMVRAQAAGRIAEAASGALERHDAALSAHSGLSGRQRLALAAAGLLWAASAMLAPEQTALVISSALWALFAGAIVLRNLAVAAAHDGPRCAPLDDIELPIYTIIAPLRGEERMVGKLTRALDALDYPGIR